MTPDDCFPVGENTNNSSSLLNPRWSDISRREPKVIYLIWWPCIGQYSNHIAAISSRNTNVS